MVKRLYAMASESVADFVENSKRKNEGKRQFIIYYNKGDEFFVLGEKTPEDGVETSSDKFKIGKGVRIRAATIENLLRPALPLFCSTDIDSMRGRRERFHDDYVGYEVIRINIFGMMGIPRDSTPEQELEKNGFTIIPLAEHPHYKQLKTIVI